MFGAETLEGYGTFKTRIDVFGVGFRFSSVLAKFVYFAAAEQVPPAQ